MAEEPYERLQRARRKAGFKGPAEAAEYFGWNKNSYKSHENGMRGLSPPNAAKYGRAFHVSQAWLLTGEGQEAASPSQEEADLLARYRSLPEPDRHIVKVLCEALSARNSARPEEPAPPRRAQGGRR